MIRAIAIAASAAIGIAANMAAYGLLAAMPAEAQGFRGPVATATVSMSCFPSSSKQIGNIIVVHQGSGNVPAGTPVTVTYMEPLTVSWFGTYGWVQKTTVFRISRSLRSADPELVGVRGYCLSATYVSDQPVRAPW